MANKFTWFPKFGDAIEKMPAEMRHPFIIAIAEYGMCGTEPSFEGIENGWMLDALFAGFREDIDNSVASCNKNKGGRPRKAAPEPAVNPNGAKDGAKGDISDEPEPTVCDPVPADGPDGAETPSETPCGNPCGNPPETPLENPLEKPLGKTQYKPSQAKTSQDTGEVRAPDAPTLDDVEAYFGANCLGGDPKAFFDFYASQGWRKSNGIPIADWRAQARQWHRMQRERDADARSRGKPTASEVEAATFKPVPKLTPEEELAQIEEEARRYGIAL